MANELTTLIMNNIVQQCSGYKSNNSGKSASNANPVGGKHVSLPSSDVKNLTDLIHKNGKVNTSSTQSAKVHTNNNVASSVKHLDDLIGKKVSKSLSGSTAKIVEKTPVRSTSNNNMSLDSYLKGLKK